MPQLPVDESVKDKVMVIPSLDSVDRKSGTREPVSMEKVSKTVGTFNELGVVGAGPLATQCSLMMLNRGAKMHQVFFEPKVLYKYFPEHFASWVQDQLASAGVQIHSNSKIAKITKSPSGRVNLQFENGDKLEVDQVHNLTAGTY